MTGSDLFSPPRATSGIFGEPSPFHAGMLFIVYKSPKTTTYMAWYRLSYCSQRSHADSKILELVTLLRNLPHSIQPIACWRCRIGKTCFPCVLELVVSTTISYCDRHGNTNLQTTWTNGADTPIADTPINKMSWTLPIPLIQVHRHHNPVIHRPFCIFRATLEASFLRNYTHRSMRRHRTLGSQSPYCATLIMTNTY